MDGQQYAPQLSGVLYTQQTAAGDKHMNYNASRHWTGTSLRVVDVPSLGERRQL